MPQSLVKLYTHLVFTTRHRQSFIDETLENELYPYMSKIFRECDSPCIKINGAYDHIQALFQLSKKWAICDEVEEVKKCSSKWAKTKGEQYKNFYWQNGCGAFSVSESGIQNVIKYINIQKSHHKQSDFEEEFIGLLKKAEIRKTIIEPETDEDSINGRKNATKHINQKWIKVTYKKQNEILIIITAINKNK
ncbi:MAG: transposase [Bacteroidota bacterium]